MIRIGRQIVVSLLLLLLYSVAAVPPAAADPGRGRFGGCIQLCNMYRETCVENFAQVCADLYLGSAEYGACITGFLPTCNLVAFDCKYNYCLGGDPEPLRVLTRSEEKPELPRAVE